MKYNLPEIVRQDICKYAKKNGIESVILFGSRARGTNTERSDIYIAVCGENFDDFYWDINENVNSLLIFDLIDINGRNSQELMNEIERDGVFIYEKAR
ncbi:MAG: nucleotidyltransferase domain-containing protein [Synergistaceae bacterium]|nr:nucleotidyltransferase domain-containing protein [Synergistaceae bacterium]